MNRWRGKKFLRYIMPSVALLALLSSWPAGARQIDSTPHDGIWRQHGYGRILEIRSGSAKSYAVTSISCIPENDDYNLARYRDVTLDETGNLLTLFSRNGNSYWFGREENLPAECASYEPTRDPQHNFEVFWRIFEENYAFFHIHDVDWSAMYRVFRPQVGPQTTDEELLEIFGQMVAPLQDAHTSIRSPVGRIGHSGYELRSRREDVWQLVERKHLKGNFETRLGQLSYGLLDEKTGYLRVKSMSGFASYQSLSRQETLELLEQTMDEIVAGFEGLDKVILDVRFNGGGSDEYSRVIAERFTDQRRLAYSKQARYGGATDYTPMVEFHLEPGGPFQFTGSVVVLINGASVSATEIFMQCMQALPHVTIVGESTEGAFSDNLGKMLPNGWRLSLSNEVYYNYRGVVLEGIGVVPDIEVPLTVEDLEANRDLALEKALALETK